MSKGEVQVQTILETKGILFEREKSFKDLKGGLFRYDFYFRQGEDEVIIEVDGVQHFEQRPQFFKTRDEFLRAQEHDRRKNSFCLAKGIKLFRIPYWDLDSIKDFEDLFKEKYRVKDKWHNDKIKKP